MQNLEFVYLWVMTKSFPVPKSRPARAWNKSEYFYRKVIVLLIWSADSGVLQQVDGANSGHNSVLERRITGINVHLQLIKLRRSVAWEHNVPSVTGRGCVCACVCVFSKAYLIVDLPHWNAENKLKPVFYHDCLIHITCSLSTDHFLWAEGSSF